MLLSILVENNGAMTGLFKLPCGVPIGADLSLTVCPSGNLMYASFLYGLMYASFSILSFARFTSSSFSKPKSSSTASRISLQCSKTHVNTSIFATRSPLNCPGMDLKPLVIRKKQTMREPFLFNMPSLLWNSPRSSMDINNPCSGISWK